MPVIYIDESGIDKFMDREYARAPRGERVIGFIPGRRYKRVNVIGAQCGGKALAPLVYGWTTDAEWFETWFCDWLLPQSPMGSIFVMDNASWHNKKRLRQLAAARSCYIIFQPKYSPDKTPIEHLWANLKKWLRNFASHSLSIQDNIYHYFQLD